MCPFTQTTGAERIVGTPRHEKWLVYTATRSGYPVPVSHWFSTYTAYSTAVEVLYYKETVLGIIIITIIIMYYLLYYIVVNRECTIDAMKSPRHQKTPAGEQMIMHGWNLYYKLYNGMETISSGYILCYFFYFTF